MHFNYFKTVHTFQKYVQARHILINNNYSIVTFAATLRSTADDGHDLNWLSLFGEDSQALPPVTFARDPCSLAGELRARHLMVQ